MNDIIEQKLNMNPIYKFNNGRGATLCNVCRVIITEGHTEDLICPSCENFAEHRAGMSIQPEKLNHNIEPKIPKILQDALDRPFPDIVQSCVHNYSIKLPYGVYKEERPENPSIDYEDTFMISFAEPSVRLSLNAAKELYEQLGKALEGCEINPKKGNLSTEEMLEKWKDVL